MKNDSIEPIFIEGEIWKDIPDYEGIYKKQKKIKKYC